MTQGIEPPASRVPSIANGTATTPPSVRMPRVKGFAHAPGMNPITAPVDWIDPPETAMARPIRRTSRRSITTATRSPAFASLGIAVPLGTHTGWNVYRDQPDELADRDGSFIAFARTRAEREAAADPRPSLDERYGNRDAYAAQVKAAAATLVAERLLLPEDAERFVTAAKACDRF